MGKNGPPMHIGQTDDATTFNSFWFHFCFLILDSFDNSPDECSKKIFEPQIEKQKSSVTSKNNTVDSSEPATVTDDTFLLQKSNSTER